MRGFLFTLVIEGLLMALYVRLAQRQGWFDTPNDRSTHTDHTTVRSAGVVWVLVGIVVLWMAGNRAIAAGFGLLAVVSFADDVRSLPIGLRLSTQLVAIGVLLMAIPVWPDVWPVPLLWLAIGLFGLNTVNFMDGINGMLVLTGLVTSGSLLWLFHQYNVQPPAAYWLPATIAGLVLLGFVNVRRKALAFAGDVGSLGLAYTWLAAIFSLIQQTQTYLPLLLLAVYGADVGLTLCLRIVRHENLLRAHRQHLFQRLMDAGQRPAIELSAAYALLQAAINALVCIAMRWPAWAQWIVAILISSGLAGLYGLLWRLTNKKADAVNASA